MQRVYPTRINWENEPSTVSPINDTNLNKMDSALYEIDGRVVTFDTTKANQSDLLTCVSSVTYNENTGVFTFTWKNGTSTTVDLNIEKIPVSFSMSPQGVITMTTADGTEYTADVSSLIKTYSFTNSSTINFTVTTDASGNKTVTANIPDGSITGDKLQPNYLADCQEAVDDAETAAQDAETASSEASEWSFVSESWAVGKRNGQPVPSTHPAYQNNSKWYSEVASQDSEAWAIGTRGGQPVPSTDPTYHNNSKYWSEQSAAKTFSSLSDVNIDESTLVDGQVPVWNATNEEWENGTVSSFGGVGEQLLRDTVGWTGKNLLKNTENTVTRNGVTFTVNSDKSVTINGTATAYTTFRFTENRISDFSDGSYIVSDGLNYTETGNLWIVVWDNTTSRSLARSDRFSNDTFTVDSIIRTHDVVFEIAVDNGKTISNTTIKPMVRYASLSDDTYEPYHHTVEGDKISWSEPQGYVGKNLLKNTRTSFNTSGLTVTVNADKSVTVNGTATANTDILIHQYTKDDYIKTFGAGNTVIMTGCPQGGSDTTYNMRVHADPWADVHDDNGNGVTFTIPSSSSATTYYVWARVRNGTVCNNLTFKPMIRLSSILNSTYESYLTPNTDLMSYADNAILGAKNFLPNLFTTITSNGITLTKSGDYLSLSGTATANTSFTCDLKGVIPFGSIYKLKLLGTTYDSSTMNISISYKETSSSDTRFFIPDKYIDTSTFIADPHQFSIAIYVANGVTPKTNQFRLMVILASDTDDTYVPYAMTNKQLTDVVNGLSGGSVPQGGITNQVLAKNSNTNYDTKWVDVPNEEQLIKVEEQLIKDTVGWVGKNLLENNNKTTRTINGITWTYDAIEHSYIANGTATANSPYNLFPADNSGNVGVKAGDVFKEWDKDYILTGCPANGSNFTYFLRIVDLSYSIILATDTGNGVTFRPSNIQNLTRDTYIKYIINVDNGQTVNNLTFYPMLRLASITDPTFEPYHPTVDGDKISWSESKGYVGKNRFKPTALPQTKNGVTWTFDNNDNSWVANGTAANNSALIVGIADKIDGVVTISGCPSGGTGSTYEIQVVIDGTYANYHEYGSGNLTMTLSSEHTYELACIVRNGYTANNLVFKPMIRLSSISDSTYEPYLTPNTEIDNKLSYADNTVLGAKNLINNTATTQTKNGVTFTVNADKSVTLSGTSTGNTLVTLYSLKGSQIKAFGNTLILSGGSQNAYFNIHKSDFSYNKQSWGEDKIIDTTVLEDNTEYKFSIGIDGTKNVNGMVIYPMIRLASDTDNTYAPYAMTNRELTDASNTLADIIESIKPTILEATLVAGQTTKAFTNSAITSTAFIDVYTDNPTVSPTAMSVSGTTLTLTFKEQSSNVEIRVKVS